MPVNYENEPSPLSKTNPLHPYSPAFQWSRKGRLKQTLTLEVNYTHMDNQASFYDCKKIFTPSLDFVTFAPFQYSQGGSNFTSKHWLDT